jgi:hypothetical protein
MKKILVIILVHISISISFSQTPLQRNDFNKLTSYEELISFVEKICGGSQLMSLEYIGQSVEGRKIPAVKISTSKFGVDTSKIKMMIFAQQHGNEQSGKEGALHLLSLFNSSELTSLLENIDLIIVPQVNPDGSEKNQRRNSNDMDLNRNHLILTEPETIALHNLFNENLPHVTLDVHEYFPYSEDWEAFGYLKNFDEQFGLLTNPNVSDKIKEFSNKEFLPFIENHLTEKGYTFHNYLVGGSPNVSRIRHSTVDINDGRQSFGILNSFSFILEGKNGLDRTIENIERRTAAQAEAMIGLLRFVSLNKDKIKRLVNTERERLVKGNVKEKIVVRMEHVRGEKPLSLPLFSKYSKQDTIVTVEEYHPLVEKILKVEKPDGYLIPDDEESTAKVLEVLRKHRIIFYEYEHNPNDRITKYQITEIDSINLEETQLADLKIKEIELNFLQDKKYHYVPISQLYCNTLILALEPQSMLGLIHYESFKDLIRVGEDYPILRLIKKRKN